MKARLRREMKVTLTAMSPEAAAAGSAAACASAVSLPEFRHARTVMLYLPIPGEVDTVEVALAAWRQDKTVLVPKVLYEHWRIAAVVCRSMDDGLVPNRHGIREPAAAECWPPEEIDLVIVPALAFDKQGNRLGRGGGFYDRFLAEPGVRAVLCGLAFDIQVLDELPAEHHDRPVDVLVTDKEVRRFWR